MHEVQPWLDRGLAAVNAWNDSYGSSETHPSLIIDDGVFEASLRSFLTRLEDNYPFGHPRYAGQMLKPPHPAAVVGYVTAMAINPNNHALDGGPATARMEIEAVAEIARMFGLPQHLGHLTSSGTIANLEALWVARETHPDRGIAFSSEAHYTHARMCDVLRVPGHPIRAHADGRMDLAELERVLATGAIGTVVATLGTTARGTLDPLHEIIEIARRHDVRVHVDAAYGGFFALIADDSADGVASAPFVATADADSIVVDPHKHGLQPYGCGAVMFADPGVGRFYRHDSPYTYFTSEDLHLGEISLECSRPGAAAAALWLTLQVLPLSDDGLGSVLRACRRAALEWHARCESSSVLAAIGVPELDVVTYAPVAPSVNEVSRLTDAVFTDLADRPRAEQIHLATLAMAASDATALGLDATVDDAHVRVFRSVLMKPEHETAVTGLIDAIEMSVERATSQSTGQN